MKKAIAAAAMLAASAGTVWAADMVVKAPPPPAAAPSIFDFAAGGAVMSDYNFRGISQSDRGPAVNAYFEPRINFAPNWQLYAGIAGTSVKLPTDPTAEIDFYGGIRPTFGPLALDFGAIYYYYPRERQIDGVIIRVPNGNTTLSDTDYWEVYAKGVYTFNDYVAVGANLYYTPSWLNSGADGTFLSGTLKLTAPGTWLPAGFGLYLSGELGRQWLGFTKNDPIAFPGGWDLPSYTYWSAGFGITYKVFTLDFRYHDTDLSKEECNVLTADPGATIGGGTPIPITNVAGNRSNWCSAAFVAKLSVDITRDSLK